MQYLPDVKRWSHFYNVVKPPASIPFTIHPFALLVYGSGSGIWDHLSPVITSCAIAERSSVQLKGHQLGEGTFGSLISFHCITSSD